MCIRDRLPPPQDALSTGPAPRPGPRGPDASDSGGEVLWPPPWPPGHADSGMRLLDCTCPCRASPNKPATHPGRRRAGRS
eukprot:15447528-Alexandrium_andersonii.AAC.1